MPEQGLPRDELDSAIAARQELGRDYESAVVESFMERVSEQIDARVDARLAEQGREKKDNNEDEHAMGVALGSMGIGIPITGAAGYTGGVAAIIAVWVAIALINIAYNVGRAFRG